MKRLIRTLFVLFYAWCGFTGRALAQSAEPEAHRFFEPKEGKDVTFYTPGGELTFYGYLDVSVDVTTKGISDFKDSNGNGPTGHVGWMPALSTNQSYLGGRGFVKLGEPLRFVWQLDPTTGRVLRAIPLRKKDAFTCAITATPKAVWVTIGDANC